MLTNNGNGVIITLKQGKFMIGTIGKTFPSEKLLNELKDASMYDEVDVNVGIIDEHKFLGAVDVEDVEFEEVGA